MHINKYNLIRNLALLFIAGNMVGWLFPFPNVVWRLALVLLSLYVIVFEEGKRLTCEKALLVFIAFNLLHFFISFLWKNPSYTQIGNILCALLPLSLFACLSQKEVMNHNFFTFAGSLIMLCGILRYYYYERMAIMGRAADDVDVVNNATVTFLMVLPMVFLIKNNILKWAFVLVCVFFIVMGAKRGNILAAFIPLLLFVRYVLKDSQRSSWKTIVVLIAIVGSVFITYRWVAHNDFLMYRIEQTQNGYSSNRNIIYAGAWHVWYDSDSFFTYFFGYGFDGTLKHEATLHHHAHNDWLEVLVDYGLFGAILYLVIFITFFLQVRRIKSNEMRMALFSGLFIWFFKTLYSMGFTGETLSVAMISMGTALGSYKNEKEQL